MTYTSEDIKRMSKMEEYQSDWEKVDGITHEQLDEMIKNDPDDLHLEEFKDGEWVHNFKDLVEKERISIRLDKDILNFFKKQGKGYQSKINNVLRAFVESYSQQ